MGNALKKIDEEKKAKASASLSEWLQGRSVPLPREGQPMPDHFSDNAEAVNWWFVAQTSGISQKQQTEWMKQKFAIGSRDPLSFYERKRKSVISADNPFPTTQSEAENILLDKIAEHAPFKRGGRMDTLHHSGRRKFI